MRKFAKVSPGNKQEKHPKQAENARWGVFWSRVEAVGGTLRKGYTRIRFAVSSSSAEPAASPAGYTTTRYAASSSGIEHCGDLSPGIHKYKALREQFERRTCGLPGRVHNDKDSREQFGQRTPLAPDGVNKKGCKRPDVQNKV